MAAPLARSDLGAYREADRFIAAIDEEFYLHFAGHKETLDVAPIYERYADLTTLEQAERLAATVRREPCADRGSGASPAKSYLGALTREQAERVANLEASLTAEIDGETIGFRALRPTALNEPDRERRARLEGARVELTEEHLLTLYLEAAEERLKATTRLGAQTYREALRALPVSARPDGAAVPRPPRCDRGRVRRHARRDLPSAGRSRPRGGKAPMWLQVFGPLAGTTASPRSPCSPALEATLSDLGIDLRSQENIELDVEQRPQKSPRAFCAPIEVPGRIVLVIQPVGGADDWRALFREAGHTEHFAHIEGLAPRRAPPARRPDGERGLGRAPRAAR